MTSTYAIVAPVAYLLGSIPFGYILVKLFLKQDIRQTGSGNIGATNVARSGKKGLAIATLLLDAAKGSLAVLVTRSIFPSEGQPGYVEGVAGIAAVLAALFAVIGHCFPIWLKFQGGKGVATAVGALVMVAPVPALVSLVIFALVFAVTKFVSLGSIIAAAVFPIVAYFNLQPAFRLRLVAMLAAMSAIVIVKHRANIGRLLAGTEPKFGSKSVPKNPVQAEHSA